MRTRLTAFLSPRSFSRLLRRCRPRRPHDASTCRRPSRSSTAASTATAGGPWPRSARRGDRAGDCTPSARRHLAASRRRGRRAAPVALAALLLALVLAPQPAAAQFPVTDVAHTAVNSYWHYVHYIQAAYQIYQQVQQLANQVRQLQAQLRALAKLRDPNWRQIQTLLGELDGLMRSGRALGYPLADAGAQFRQVFPGWSPWLDPAAPQLQAERALDTLRAGLAATSQQSRSFAPGEDLLAAVRQQMGRTDGHQQALEQVATLSAFAAQEQLLTRQALAVANNQAAVAHGYWLNRQAQGDASFSLLMTETSLGVYQEHSPGWTFRPSWQR
jgi:P-type conjugative transfer protein TrbJ